ncbi:hypothetical protein F5144DRAFT_570097 [Chaetomium tenue]|uniref:Uncharacterized protein n=1 Tax=Chaetomium tenue TaxID=1854479 RepID=A0ACB7PEK6_9PEZI|nr:hypothetical protein F5144DRAFT_570097 [Chaetomium globosum]
MAAMDYDYTGTSFINLCSGITHLPEYCGTESTLDLDQRMLLALLLYGPTPTPSPSYLADEDLLQKLTAAFFRKYVIQLINGGLTVPTSETISGTLTGTEDQLTVRPLAAHCMAAAFALSMVLAAVLAAITPRGGILPRAPNTIAGMATDLATTRHDWERWTSAAAIKSRMERETRIGIEGALDQESRLIVPWLWRPHPLRTRHAGPALPVSSHARNPSSKIPIIIHPFTRYAVTIAVVTLIIVLEAVQQRARARDGVEGIAEITAGDTFFNYLWSYGPAIAVLLLSSYQTSLDFTMRSRQPLKSMCGQRGASHSSSVCLNMIDRLPPATLITEIRTGSVVALSATAASILASFLAVFSASLYSIKTIELSLPNRVQLLDSFAPYLGREYEVSEWGLVAAPLILTKNMSYPAFTYENLVFPTLGLEHPFAGNQTGDAGLPHALDAPFNVAAQIPGVQSRLNCRFYDSSEMISGLRPESPRWMVEIPGATVIHDYEFNKGQTCTISVFSSNNSDFALGVSGVSIEESQDGDPRGDGRPWMDNCATDYLYVWGTASPTANGSSLAVYGCNETIEAVEVAVNLLGPDLRIDPSNRPRIVDGTQAAITALRPNKTFSLAGLNWRESSEDTYLHILGSQTMLASDLVKVDEFFRLLTTPGSPASLPLSSLTNLTQKHRVAEAIHRQHGIIRAQSLNADYRRPRNIPGTIKLGGNLTNNVNDPNYDFVLATVTDPLGRTRLMQDPTSTRVLQALLAAILLLSAAGWVGGTGAGTWSRRIGRLASGFGFGCGSVAPVGDGHAAAAAGERVVWGLSLTCIADVMALLVGSEVFDVLPDASGRGGQGGGDIVEALRGLRFKLGWVNVEHERGGWGEPLEMDAGADRAGKVDKKDGGTIVVETKVRESENKAGGDRVFTIVVTTEGEDKKYGDVKA